MVFAFKSYTNGNLQFFGNVLSVEFEDECTGKDCQTGEGVSAQLQGNPGKKESRGSEKKGKEN